MRGYFQHDENDCGLACICTVCKCMKVNVDQYRLRKETILGNEGLSLYGMVEILKGFSIDAYAVSGKIDELYQVLERNSYPIVIMINENNSSHYIVILKRRKNKIYIWDPDKGNRILTDIEINEIWTGYAIIIDNVYSNDIKTEKTKLFCKEMFKKEKSAMISVLLMSILLMIVGVCSTFTYKVIIEQIEFGIKIEISYLKILFCILFLCYVLLSFLFIIKSRFLLKLSNKIDFSLHSRFIDSLLCISPQKNEDYASGGIIDRYQRLPVVTTTMSSLFSSVIMEMVSMLVGIYILFNINKVMFGLLVCIVFAYLLSYVFSHKKIYYLNKSLMDKEAKIITNVNEISRNLISLKNINIKNFRAKLHSEVAKVKKEEFTLKSLSVNIEGILEMIESILMLSILVYGITMIMQEKMSIATLLAFESFSGFFLSPIKNVLNLLPTMQETLLTFKRVEEIFVHAEEKFSQKCIDLKGNIEVSDLEVTYGYNSPILKNINFNISAGEDVFFVGESGSGKTALAKTVANIIKYQHGTICIDNSYIVGVDSLFGQVLYVSQEPEIFCGTVKDNILLWQDDTDMELFKEVLYEIGISEMLVHKGITIESNIHENGTNLSGGEKQRIMIARALMQKASIYIFDEATCHLDAESEIAIINYIREKLKDRTCLFITHNGKILRNQDSVIYLDDGFVYKDNHLQMIEKNNRYREVFG